MNQILLAIAGPALIGAVIGAVILWDRLREPHRNLYRPVTVVDRRTYKDAVRRIERLASLGEWTKAHNGTVAILTWLNGERGLGSPRRKQWVAAQLEHWQARKAEFDPKAEVRPA